jgi:glycosyltransferase involved in cell wall biosynthesis
MAKQLVLMVPRPGSIGVRAPWIALRNWSRAVEAAGRIAVVVSPEGAIDLDREISRVPVRRRPPANDDFTGRLRRVVSGSLADAKALRRVTRGRSNARTLESQLHDASCVVQYHTLFERTGYHLAESLQVPFALLVDAPIVWEGRTWGRNRSLSGDSMERHGEIWQARRADVVVCVSEDARRRIGAWGVDSSKIRVVGNPVDTSQFAPQRGEQSQKEVVIGWIGGFLRFHRIDLLLDAYGQVISQRPLVRLRMVGDGPLMDSFAQDVTRRALPGVEFTGAVAPECVPSALTQFDIGVVSAGPGPFHYSPMKLREYLSTGLAVVAPNTGEPGRLLEHRSTAMLYRPGDAQDLAAQLLELVDSAELRASLGSAGRRLAEREFSMSAVGSSLLRAVEHPHD